MKDHLRIETTINSRLMTENLLIIRKFRLSQLPPRLHNRLFL